MTLALTLLFTLNLYSLYSASLCNCTKCAYVADTFCTGGGFVDHLAPRHTAEECFRLKDTNGLLVKTFHATLSPMDHSLQSVETFGTPIPLSGIKGAESRAVHVTLKSSQNKPIMILPNTLHSTSIPQ